MISKRLVPLAVAAATGALMALTMPSWDQAWLAWVAMAPLFYLVLRAERPRDAFFLGWTHAFVFFEVSTHWLVFTLTEFGYIPRPISIVLYTLLSMVLACFPGFAMATLAWLPRGRAWAGPLTAGLFWVAWEYFRTVHFNGFPWNLVGLSQHPWLPVIQFSELTGIYGVSALVVAVNWALAQAVHDRPERRLRGALEVLAIPALLVAAAVAFGVWRIDGLEAEGPNGDATHVALIQGNVDQHMKWTGSFRDHTIGLYERLTTEAVEEGPTDLVIWPETAMPFFFQSPSKERARVTHLARRHGVNLLLGSPAFEVKAGRDYDLRNRAFLLGRDGKQLGTYDKLYLVPFGEYNPLPFVRQIVEAAGNFTPGTEANTIAFEAGKIGVLICYEGVVPDLPRRLVKDGAGLLVNMTNDAWFGRTVAPYQHLVQEAYRAAENKVPMVRAANTGVSAVIRPTGEIVRGTPIYEEATLRAAVELRPGGTFYSRYGNLFAFAAVLYYGGSVIVHYRRLLAKRT